MSGPGQPGCDPSPAGPCQPDGGGLARVERSAPGVPDVRKPGELLASSPLLLLFAVVALGYPISKIRIAGASLGIASILFAGIAIGALDPRLKLPEMTYLLGLAVFVYAIGLSSAQSFLEFLQSGGNAEEPPGGHRDGEFHSPCGRLGQAHGLLAADGRGPADGVFHK